MTVGQMIAGRMTGRIAVELVDKRGSRILAEGNATGRFEDGRCVSIRMILHDVTARKKYEEELQKAEKLESIGVLAGGIAHDFNNLLTGILGNLSIARTRAGVSQGAADTLTNLSKAENACFRARDLTQQLLIFSKGGAPVRKATSIADILRESAEFSLRGSSVRCEFDLSDDLPPVDIDEGQIVQVLNNLVINAGQAMPDGGTLRVGARSAAVGPEDPLPIPNGRYVRVTVSDTGIGIPKEALAEDLRPLLHDEGEGERPGADHGVFDSSPPRRHDHRRIRTWRRDDIHHVPARIEMRGPEGCDAGGGIPEIPGARHGRRGDGPGSGPRVSREPRVRRGSGRNRRGGGRRVPGGEGMRGGPFRPSSWT